MSVKKKVLLVDDSKTVLLMEQMCLGREPYELSTASNGREAVDKATSERPDLILMDVMMPTMGGFEAVRALRAQESTRHIPVIMVTTRSELENVTAGYESGCNDYVFKPINAPELLAKVRNHIGS